MGELIVVRIGRSKYGIWKDAVLSTKEIQGIHWLPMSPRRISGVADVEGRLATIFDLGVCLGHPPFERKRPGRVLVVSEGKKFEGFVYGEEAGRLELSSEELLPMPGCMRAPEFVSCAVHEGDPVPVIDLKLLYERALSLEWEPPRFITFEDIAPLDAVSVKGARVFISGGEAFSAPADSIEKDPVGPGRVCPLPLAPPHVEGLRLVGGRAAAVVNLARFLGLGNGRDPGYMLLAREGDFGFLIDSDQGVAAKGAAARPMPPLASTALMPSALVQNGDIIPLLNVPALMSAPADRDLARAYKPRSRFHTDFGKKDAVVVEFSFLGMRYSLPDSEVEDMVKFRPYRRLEGIHPMMPGVAELNGDVLPVIDVAVCFGGRSRTGPGSEMICVKNGDFRVLLIAEEVFGRHTLSVSEQLELPVSLPYRYVYGCYTDESSVRLILNVEALTLHFDEKLVSEYFEALLREMDIPSPQAALDSAAAGAIAGVAGLPAESPEAVAVVSAAEAEGEVYTAEPGSVFEDDSVWEPQPGEVEYAMKPEDAAAFGPRSVPGEEPVPEEEPETAGAANEADVPMEEELKEPVETSGIVPASVFEEAVDTEPPGPEEEAPVSGAAPEEDSAGAPAVEPAAAQEKVAEETATVRDVMAEEPAAAGEEEAVKHEAAEAEAEEVEEGEQPVAEETAPVQDVTAEGPVPAAGAVGAPAFDETVVQGPSPVEHGSHAEEGMDARGTPEDGPEEQASEFGGTGVQEQFDGGLSVDEGKESSPVAEPAAGEPETVTGDKPALEEEAHAKGEEAARVRPAWKDFFKGPPLSTTAAGRARAEKEKKRISSRMEYKARALERAARFNKWGLWLAVALFLVLMIYFAAMLFGPDGARKDALHAEGAGGRYAFEEETAEPSTPEEESSQEPGRDEAGEAPTDEELSAQEERPGPPSPTDHEAALMPASPDEVPDVMDEKPQPAREKPYLEASRARTDRTVKKEARALRKSPMIILEPAPPEEMISPEKETSPEDLLAKPSRPASPLSQRLVQGYQDSSIYVVKKGDTLWHISKRFTGNPFNYVYIADENRVENPDLIFPDQRFIVRIVYR
jgi:chemotaxis signal transduction protein/nucleoid-associated protein YgaU